MKSLFLYIYILGVFTEKPYSKPLERKVVYIPIIILSHATSHDFKWRQNKPWLSTIWLDFGDGHDVIDAVPLLAEKLCVNVFLLQFLRLYHIFRQRFDWNEWKYKQWTEFFWCLSKCKLHWVCACVKTWITCWSWSVLLATDSNCTVLHIPYFLILHKKESCTKRKNGCIHS